MADLLNPTPALARRRSAEPAALGVAGVEPERRWTGTPERGSAEAPGGASAEGEGGRAVAGV